MIKLLTIKDNTYYYDPDTQRIKRKYYDISLSRIRTTSGFFIEDIKYSFEDVMEKDDPLFQEYKCAIHKYERMFYK